MWALLSIPIYQRKYSWTEKQCSTLWDDILRLSERSTNSGHFIGSIVCYQMNDEDMPGEIKEKVVIDGQQRLTTLPKSSANILYLCTILTAQFAKVVIFCSDFL